MIIDICDTAGSYKTTFPNTEPQVFIYLFILKGLVIGMRSPSHDQANQ